MPDMSIPDYQIDARGLYCPEPVMLLHKAVREVLPGQVIELVSTDPSTQRDVPKFCAFLGHALLSQSNQGELFCYRIEKSVPEKL